MAREFVRKCFVFVASIIAACCCSIVTTLLVVGSAASAQPQTSVPHPTFTVSAPSFPIDSSATTNGAANLGKAITFDGTTLRINAQTIELTGSGGAVSLSNGNFSIKATAISVQGAANVNVQAGASATMSSGGQTAIKGAVVSIN